MAGSNARRSGILVFLLVAAALVVWLSWAWSPELEEHAPVAEDVGARAVAPQPSAPAAPVPAPQAAREYQAHPAKAPEPAAAPPPQEAPAEPPPERIPTPHPMSLDQTKPPEQYGALSELKNQYASESHAASSTATETKLRSMISDAPNIPSELVQGISCRRTTCKLDVQWTKHRRIGFAVLLESFKQLYDKRVAVEPASERSEGGVYLTTLYVRVVP